MYVHVYVNFRSIRVDFPIKHAGKLPVDVDMDWIPETHQLGSELSEPPPPPIPPKMMMVEDWSSENFVDREQKHLKPTELESSVPTLPPKPNNRLAKNAIKNQAGGGIIIFDTILPAPTLINMQV